jgi:hypothetical protein
MLGILNWVVPVADGRTSWLWFWIDFSSESEHGLYVAMNFIWRWLLFWQFPSMKKYHSLCRCKYWWWLDWFIACSVLKHSDFSDLLYLVSSLLRNCFSSHMRFYNWASDYALVMMERLTKIKLISCVKSLGSRPRKFVKLVHYRMVSEISTGAVQKMQLH